MQDTLGVEVGGYRPRGGYGQFDYPGWSTLTHNGVRYVAPPPAGAALTSKPIKNLGMATLSPDHLLSTNITPKAGTGGERFAVKCADVLDGRWDEILDQCATSLRSVTGEVHCEIWSEADILNAPPAAQPAPPDPENQPAMLGYIVAFLRAAGVGPNVRFGLSIVSGKYAGAEWTRWWTPQNRAVFDVLGADAYAKPDNNWRSPLSIVEKPWQRAREIGKPLAVYETGCAEKSGDPQLKPSWMRGLLAVTRRIVEEDPGRLALVTINHGDSSGGTPYGVTTTQETLVASREFFVDSVWR